jgi:hypothetical protein
VDIARASGPPAVNLCDGARDKPTAASRTAARAAPIEVAHADRQNPPGPARSEIRSHLGDAYWRTGREGEARKSWEQALSLKPDPADAAKIKGKIARGLEK